jgi:hypothetical protein
MERFLHESENGLVAHENFQTRKLYDEGGMDLFLPFCAMPDPFIPCTWQLFSILVSNCCIQRLSSDTDVRFPLLNSKNRMQGSH